MGTLSNLNAEDTRHLQADERKARTTFKIPEDNIGALTEKIEALNRRAKRMKCQPIETKVLNHFVSEQTFSEVVLGGYKEYKRKVLFFTVEITGAAPIIPGWEFLGTLVHYEVANVLRAVPGKEIPEDFRHRGQLCDHCGKKRSRKDTYIVRNVESGEIKQVGHSCLKDFLGHVSPSSMGLGAELLETMIGLERDFVSHSNKPSPIFLQRYLEMVAEIALTRGYVSKAASNSYAEKSGGFGLPITSKVAALYCRPSATMILEGDVVTPSEKAIELAEAALKEVRELNPGNSFEANMKIVASREFVEGRDYGLAASIIGSYLKKQGMVSDRHARKEKEKSTSNFFGEVGKRDVFTLHVHNQIHLGEIRVGRGYKTIYLYKMTDQDGNVAIWKTDSTLEVGETYKVKATVKAHSYYQNVKQTVLTRIQVLPSENEVKTVVQGEFNFSKEK